MEAVGTTEENKMGTKPVWPLLMTMALPVVHLSRNYLILIPAAWLLSLTGILDAVWLSVPAADIVSAATGFLLMLRFYRRDIKPMQG